MDLVTARRERDDALARARALEHELGALRGQMRRLELVMWRRAATRRRLANLRRRLRDSDEPVQLLVKVLRVRWADLRRRVRQPADR
jgi:hypothetical protein